MGINLRLASSPNGTKNTIPPVNSKNFVSDFGAVGDGQRATVNITVSSGSPTLTVVGATPFDPGTVAGKTISIWNGSSYKTGVVQASPAPTSNVVTLNSNIGFTVTNSSSEILWGTDNTNALTGPSGSWRAWAQTQTNPASPPVLYVPDGNFAYFSSSANGGALHYGVMNNAKVSGISGNAANCKLMQFGNGEMRFGTDPAIVANRGYNTTQSGGNSVRLASALAGATSGSVVSYNATSADGSRFDSRITVGRVCLLACFDMQGINDSFFGYPPNSFFFEWNVIAGYNSSTGAISFQNPLTQDYKSTFPRWGLENTQFGSDQGGPFTMWVAPDGYNNRVTLENMTIDCPRNQCAVHMRYVTLNNLVMNGPGIYPTQGDVYDINNCVYTQGLEVDKMTNEVTFNGTTLTNLQQQSASPNRMILNGGSVVQLETAKYTEANNVNFTGTARLVLGVSSYGSNRRTIINSCTNIAIVQRGGVQTDDLNGTNGTSPQQNASTFYSFTAGVIRFLKTQNDSTGGTPGNTGQQNLTRAFVPGTWVLFDDKYIDQVTDVYEDGTYCYVQFANTTSFPFTTVRLKDHPCPDLTVISSTGTAPELEDLNQMPARRPAYSFIKRAYDETLTTTGTAANPVLIGALNDTDAISINVTTAYSGGGSLSWKPTRFSNQFAVWRAGAQQLLDMTINAKIPGNRVYNGATQTWSGAQSGDSLPVLQAGDWLYGSFSSPPTLSASVAGQGLGPVITYTVKCDQGIT